MNTGSLRHEGCPASRVDKEQGGAARFTSFPTRIPVTASPLPATIPDALHSRPAVPIVNMHRAICAGARRSHLKLSPPSISCRDGRMTTKTMMTMPTRRRRKRRNRKSRTSWTARLRRQSPGWPATQKTGRKTAAAAAKAASGVCGRLGSLPGWMGLVWVTVRLAMRVGARVRGSGEGRARGRRRILSVLLCCLVTGDVCGPGQECRNSFADFLSLQMISSQGAPQPTELTNGAVNTAHHDVFPSFSNAGARAATPAKGQRRRRATRRRPRCRPRTCLMLSRRSGSACD